MPLQLRRRAVRATCRLVSFFPRARTETDVTGVTVSECNGGSYGWVRALSITVQEHCDGPAPSAPRQFPSAARRADHTSLPARRARTGCDQAFGHMSELRRR